MYQPPQGVYFIYPDQELRDGPKRRPASWLTEIVQDELSKTRRKREIEIWMENARRATEDSNRRRAS